MTVKEIYETFFSEITCIYFLSLWIFSAISIRPLAAITAVILFLGIRVKSLSMFFALLLLCLEDQFCNKHKTVPENISTFMPFGRDLSWLLCNRHHHFSSVWSLSWLAWTFQSLLLLFWVTIITVMWVSLFGKVSPFPFRALLSKFRFDMKWAPFALLLPCLLASRRN